jgi:hypothetical protein
MIYERERHSVKESEQSYAKLQQECCGSAMYFRRVRFWKWDSYVYDLRMK